MIKHPNVFSFLILGAITIMAIVYAVLTWREAPETNHFAVEELEELPQNFTKPDRIFRLPDQLKEVSGLSYWKPNQLLTIQDEDGEVFVYDLEEESISEVWKFGKDRDYEGIASIDSSIYVLEMDGDIHYFNHRPGQNQYDAKKFESLFSYRNDTEGICYDPQTQKLLVVPKEKQLNPDDQEAAQRGIYGIERSTGNLGNQPLYFVDEYRLGEIIYGPQQRHLFKPSGIAVHPISGNIYVLASVGNALVVLNRNSEILHIELLEKSLFPQPEGITFSPSGDLFISSEGKGTQPIIAKFNHPKLSSTPSPTDPNE